MIFAVLGNVDGHVEALRKALDAIEDEGIVTVLHTGNAAWGPGGSAAIALLRERGVQCVQGERDRALSKLERKRARMVKELGEDFAGYEAAHAALKSADIEWLGALPHERRLLLDGVNVLLCHGMPGDAQSFFATDTPESRLERARESADAAIVASGGAEGFFARALGDCLLVNAPALARAGWARICTETMTAEKVPV